MAVGTTVSMLSYTKVKTSAEFLERMEESLVVSRVLS